jgi:hypothetical protein
MKIISIAVKNVRNFYPYQSVGTVRYEDKNKTTTGTKTYLKTECAMNKNKKKN